MLRLPLGLSIFIPGVGFDRSHADWLRDPREHLKRGGGVHEQALAAAGLGRSPPLFDARRIPF